MIMNFFEEGHFFLFVYINYASSFNQISRVGSPILDLGNSMTSRSEISLNN